ncbi:MAG: DUF3011 domain-containing protein, partial [Pseudoxanthomonas sp.]
MLRMLSATLVVLGLLLAVPTPAQAQIQTKAYAPENLRSLSRNDQERVIGQEYSEQSRGRRIPDDQLRFYIDQVNRSSWGFSRIKQDIATSLGGNGGGWNPGNGTGTVLCESNDNRRRQCNTGFRGRAALSQNISSTRCIEGQNWGSGNGFVWVDRGCRARFVEGSLGGGNGATVRCESTDNRYRECNTGFRGNATLTRKLSDARCTEGESWGQRNNGTVWVDRGCRAEFTDGNGSWNPGGGNSNYSVTCSSQNNRRNTCAWNSRYGRPYLIQQISSDSCREGTSWGYLSNQIWVD